MSPPQYSVRRILSVWGAATVPMAVLAWVVAPWLGDRIGGPDPFIDALLICFNVGLLWMLALVLILVRREQGSLAWPRVRDALWLRAPRAPRRTPAQGPARRHPHRPNPRLLQRQLDRVRAPHGSRVRFPDHRGTALPR